MKIELTIAQQQAIEQIDKNILVTAGAGSGKTLVLVRRFVEILKQQPELRVHNLLAITYTRKAANEMRTRIKARLKELFEQAKLTGSDDQARWHQCLSEMDSACIETIHSFCQSILQSFAIEAGMDPQIAVLDDFERAQIIAETIEETFRRAIAAQDIDRTVLGHFSLEDIKAFLQTVLTNHLRFSLLAGQLEVLSEPELDKELSKLLLRVQKQLLLDLAADTDWQSAAAYLINNPCPDPSNKLEVIRSQAASCLEPIKSAMAVLRQSKNGDLPDGAIRQSWQNLLDLSALRKPGAAGGKADWAILLKEQINIVIDKVRDLHHGPARRYPQWCRRIGVPEEIVGACASPPAGRRNRRHWKKL